MNKKHYLSPKFTNINIEAEELLAKSGEGAGGEIPDAGWDNSSRRDPSGDLWEEK